MSDIGDALREACADLSLDDLKNRTDKVRHAHQRCVSILTDAVKSGNVLQWADDFSLIPPSGGDLVYRYQLPGSIMCEYKIFQAGMCGRWSAETKKEGTE